MRALVQEYGCYISKTEWAGRYYKFVFKDSTASAPTPTPAPAPAPAPAPMPVVEKRVIDSWGNKTTKKAVSSVELYVRPNTSDDKVIQEVLTKNEYQNRNVPFSVEAGDVWLDLGANIGTFSALVLSHGCSVFAYEPEPQNFCLLVRNIKELNEGFEEDKYGLYCKGVDVKAGQRKLNLCKNDPARKYNSKYRHSMVIDWESGSSVQVDCVSFDSLLCDVHPTVNAVKVDIEGAEIPLLETLTAETMSNVSKFVFEYTFDACVEMPRFWSIIERLRGIFATVHFTGVKKSTIRPPQATMVYCVKRDPPTAQSPSRAD
jgi:FkbM family methyltransferase